MSYKLSYKFPFCCYVVFQFFWTHSHSQSLPCDEDKQCINMCKKAIETDDEDETKIYKSYENYTFVHTELQCEGEETYLWSQNHWDLTENGTIINGELYELNNYCIEQTNNVAMVCWNKTPSAEATALLIVMSISIVCIVILIICNCASDELRNNHVTAIKIPFFFFLALFWFLPWISTSRFNWLCTPTS